MVPGKRPPAPTQESAYLGVDLNEFFLSVTLWLPWLSSTRKTNKHKNNRTFRRGERLKQRKKERL